MLLGSGHCIFIFLIWSIHNLSDCLIRLEWSPSSCEFLWGGFHSRSRNLSSLLYSVTMVFEMITLYSFIFLFSYSLLDWLIYKLLGLSSWHTWNFFSAPGHLPLTSVWNHLIDYPFWLCFSSSLLPSKCNFPTELQFFGEIMKVGR